MPTMPHGQAMSPKCASLHAFVQRWLTLLPTAHCSAKQALELRWRHLLRQGRAVVAVGDFNISAAPVSSHLPV